MSEIVLADPLASQVRLEAKARGVGVEDLINDPNGADPGAGDRETLDITLISVPFAQDVYNQGVGKAPAVLKAAGLVERLRAHGVTVRAETAPPLDLGEGKRLDRLGRLGLAVSDLVVGAHARGTLPVVLGGDCINAIGVSAGLRRALGSEEFGVAWFDAHGDFNTPEISLSGYLGGMPLAASCGRGLGQLRRKINLTRPVDENHVLMLGVRDLDPPERALLDTTRIGYLSPAEVRAGRVTVAAEHHFGGVSSVYLHLDIDAIDPGEAPAVNYPAPDGLSSDEAIFAARAIRRLKPLVALALSAPNPEKDRDGSSVETAIKLLVENCGAVWRPATTRA